MVVSVKIGENKLNIVWVCMCVHVRVCVYEHTAVIILPRDARDRGVLDGELTVEGGGKAASSSAAFSTFSMSSCHVSFIQHFITENFSYLIFIL